MPNKMPGLYLFENPCSPNYSSTPRKQHSLYTVCLSICAISSTELQQFLGKMTPEHHSFHISGLLPLDCSFCAVSKARKLVSI